MDCTAEQNLLFLQKGVKKEDIKLNFSNLLSIARGFICPSLVVLVGFF